MRECRCERGSQAGAGGGSNFDGKQIATVYLCHSGLGSMTGGGGGRAFRERRAPERWGRTAQVSRLVAIADDDDGLDEVGEVLGEFKVLRI